MQLLCLSGSLRSQSSATALVRTIKGLVPDNVRTERFDIGMLPHYNADIEPDVVQGFKKAIRQADGVVIVTPEYNYSVPGVLKNAIDWASRPAYNSVFKDKPVLVASVSGGALGGVRAQSHLKYILNGMLANVFVWQEIAVAQAPARIAAGKIDDPAVVDFIRPALNAFIQWISRSEYQ